jgi:hypothetical protein
MRADVVAAPVNAVPALVEDARLGAVLVSLVAREHDVPHVPLAGLDEARAGI